jgi:hypothetical protein
VLCQCGEGLGDQSRCGRLGRKVGTNHIGNDWSLRKSRLLSDHPKLARGKWGGRLHSDLFFFFFFFFISVAFISKWTLGVILIVPPPLHHLATREN